MLFYRVIDFATTNKSHAVYKVFSKKQTKNYIDDHKSHSNVDTAISDITKKAIRVIDLVFKGKKILFSKNWFRT
jgi:uncharacterized protein YcgL (UPF0745 family)